MSRTAADIESKIAELSGLDLAAARLAWREASGRDVPPGLSRDFLVRWLCYRLQVQVHGDLDRKTQRLLARLADGDVSVIAADIGPGMNLRPGTVLVREYKGEMHHTTVVEEGYSWGGKTYPTLSAVARAITKANWNGYVFFGLKTRAPKPATAHG
jgi:hypothetical protein